MSCWPASASPPPDARSWYHTGEMCVNLARKVFAMSYPRAFLFKNSYQKLTLLTHGHVH